MAFYSSQLITTIVITFNHYYYPIHRLMLPINLVIIFSISPFLLGFLLYPILALHSPNYASAAAAVKPSYVDGPSHWRDEVVSVLHLMNRSVKWRSLHMEQSQFHRIQHLHFSSSNGAGWSRLKSILAHKPHHTVAFFPRRNAITTGSPKGTPGRETTTQNSKWVLWKPLKSREEE